MHTFRLLFIKVFYTAEELRSFRTLGLDPSQSSQRLRHMRRWGDLAIPIVIKLLGFKPRSDLQFEDNIKHSLFIYPDEMVSGP